MADADGFSVSLHTPEDAIFFFTEGKELDVTSSMTDSYEKNGYVFIKGLLTPEEIRKINHAIATSPDYGGSQAIRRADAEGRQCELVLWNYPGDDIIGTVARTRKVAHTAQQLMGGDEVYQYHAKLIMKKPKTAGAHEWHQDYGYWYSNGCMFPDMLSVFIAIDPCKKENGCLQVLRGSHRAGRIRHQTVGEQAGADPARVKHLGRVCPLDFVEMDPGDALFFHCNLLHHSSPNNSNSRRFALIPAFNKRSNNPLWRHQHASYTKLDMVPNDGIMKCDRLCSSYDKWFMKSDEDNSHIFDSDETKTAENSHGP